MIQLIFFKDGLILDEFAWMQFQFSFDHDVIIPSYCLVGWWSDRFVWYYGVILLKILYDYFY